MNTTLGRTASERRYAMRVGASCEAEQGLGLTTCAGRGDLQCYLY